LRTLFLSIEQVFLHAEGSPWGEAYRAVLGFLTVPAASFLLGDHVSEFAVGGFLLLMLLSLRVVPAVFRRLLPFSNHAQNIWKWRRRVAKRYDSCQWHKLFWIGLGLSAYHAASGRSVIVVTSVVMAIGTTGMVAWHGYNLRRHRMASATHKLT